MEQQQQQERKEDAKDLLGNSIAPSPTLATGAAKSRSSHCAEVTSINDLPSEVLIQVFSQLDPLLLNNLRLVCKKWNYIINDEGTWMKSFQIRFGMLPSTSSFPSVTDGVSWIDEYFTRLKIIKAWRKATSIHQTYQLLNSEHRFNDETLCDFKMNRISVFDQKSGNFSSGNLTNGQKQTFIPGGFNLDILSFDLNWSYIVIGKTNGDVMLRNLSSTNSYTQRLSLTAFEVNEEQPRSPISSIAIDTVVDKTGGSIAVISGSFDGTLAFWNINGRMRHSLNLGEVIYNIKSDFGKFIVVNTKSRIYVLDFGNFETRNLIELGFHVNGDEDEFSHLEQLVRQKNKLDVDFGGKKIILSYKSTIRVYDFEGPGVRKLDLADGVEVIDSQFQTCSKNKLYSLNTNRCVGHDGLLYGSMLSDSSIIVWNVRDDSNSSILPQLRLHPEMNYKKISAGINHVISRNDLMSITAFALNGSVLAVSGYNGLTNIYDVFTGKFLREASIKFPKRLDHMNHTLCTTTFVKLNPNAAESSGVIACGDTIQYFQFGELQAKSRRNSASGKKPKQVNLGVHGKNEHKKKIRDGYDEYQRQLYNEHKVNEMFDRYNGTHYDNEEEEYKIALAMSANLHSNDNDGIGIGNEDEDLKMALEISKLDTSGQSEDVSEQSTMLTSLNSDENGNDDVDEELRAILELSLRER
ncbi:uncharacterized protein LODBEIA_P26360 [Lodderomyces beijingensis]|uniref:F-box domain-containing protein n=1 Tax=Lodderomyces beijingensis TaxID=1775926 RepID=A0ABP0ZJU3_9ASCO